MKTLYLYVIYKICRDILLATLFVFALMFLLESIEYFLIGNPSSFSREIIQRAPFFLLRSAAPGAVIGGAISLHFLARNEELTIIRGLGINAWRLVGLVSAPGILLGVLMLAWLEFVSIPVHKSFEVQSAHSGDIVRRNDVWFNEEDTFIFIESVEISPSQKKILARNIHRITFKGDRVEEFIHLQEAEYAQAGKARVGETVFTLPLPPADLIALLVGNTRTQSTMDIWRLTRWADVSSLSVELKLLDFWQRLSWPLLFATLLLLLTVVVLHSSPRGNLFRNIVLTIVIGLSAQMVFTLFSLAGMILEIPVVLACILPILIGASASAWFVLRKI